MYFFFPIKKKNAIFIFGVYCILRSSDQFDKIIKYFFNSESAVLMTISAVTITVESRLSKVMMKQVGLLIKIYC